MAKVLDRFRRRSPDERERRRVGEMTLLEHLDEVRRRLVRCLIYIAIGFAISFVLFDSVLSLITKDFLEQIGQPELQCFGPACAVALKLKVSAYMAIAIAMPGILFELWRFVAPGLTPKEKRWSRPIVPLIFVFFVFGMFFGWLTLPAAYAFILNFAGSAVSVFPSANDFLSFFVFYMLAFGLSFEFPLVLVFLQATGIITWRSLLKSWRYAIVGIVVFAAVITPSVDWFSLALMAAPMVVFYFGAALVGWLLFGRRSASDEDQRVTTEAESAVEVPN